MDIHARVCALLEGGSPWSDVHLHVGLPLRIRDADMALRAPEPVDPVTDSDFAQFVARITRYGAKWSDELDRREGDLDCSAEVQTARGAVRFRTNLLRHGAGQCRPGLVMRRIADQVPALDTLGLPPVVARFGERASGLLLFTGVTGSGKSTSMAALLAHIADGGEHNVITLEDPVEYLLGGYRSQVLQREIGAGKDCRSFAAGLRAALREDPDIILVGEIRDAETAELALTAAQTGHLVLSTLHTRSAVHTVDRLVAMFAAEARDDVRARLAGCLLGVVSQLLLPRIGGGRSLVAEVMVATPAVASLIRVGSDGQSQTHQLPNQIRQDGRAGSRLLNAHLIDLLRAGRIERDVALAAAYDHDGLLKDIGG